MNVNCNKLGYRLCTAQQFMPEYTRCQNSTSFSDYVYHIALRQLKTATFNKP